MESISLFIVLLLLSAMYSAAETSFLSLRDSQVLLMERRREQGAMLVARLKRDPQRLLATLLIGNNLVNVSIASLATVLAVDHFQSLGAGIATGFTTIVILLGGELFPKTIAWGQKEYVSRILALPIFLSYILFYPVSSLFGVLEKLIRRYITIDAPNLVSEEEIRIMAELGLAHGEIDHSEREMIENIFQFDDIPVKSVMTAADRITSLDGDAPVERIAHFVAHTAYSRYPVFLGREDNYIGYIHTNDVMRVLSSDERDHPVVEFVSPLHSIAESVPLRDAFRMMTRENSHIFMVHRDEAKDVVVGLVTLENILETIVGEIHDEGDHREMQNGKRA